MGNQAGTLNNDEIGVLGKRSHFTEIEIKALFTRFKKEVSPHSGISKIEFQTTLSNQFGLSDSFLQNLLFGMFDVDGDNQISFEEFLKAFSILSRGTADEKLECKTNRFGFAFFLCFFLSFFFQNFSFISNV